MKPSPIRAEFELRAESEADLRVGELLAAPWHRVESEFLCRAEAAIERWKREGGGHQVDEVMVKLQERLDYAKRQAAEDGYRP